MARDLDDFFVVGDQQPSIFDSALSGEPAALTYAALADALLLLRARVVRAPRARLDVYPDRCN